MTARVLVVDDVEANVRLLQAKLQHEYYDVITATRGDEALRIADAQKPDIILLDVMMPGMDGFETCRRLKALPDTRHIPVVMVTALDGRTDRIRGLMAGAEDFLTKPVDDVQLIARVKSLVRLKIVSDELRAREESGVRLGVIGEDLHADPVDFHRVPSGRILVVDDDARQVRLVQNALSVEHRVLSVADEENGVAPDLVVVSLAAKTFDGCKVIAKMRSATQTRHLPILAIIDPDIPERAVRALELGAHDIIARPLDEDELTARTRTLMRRKRYVDALRERLDHSMELAVTDQLTGLFNRRFLFAQLEPLVQRAACGGDPVSVMLIDIDHFKQINDRFGHDIGDLVLKEFSARLASNTRPIDFACRLGGEEFVVIMPNTEGDVGCLAAERLRRHIAAASFSVDIPGGSLDVTASIGVAQTEGVDDTAELILKRADDGLYEAKSAGRNRVIGRRSNEAAA
ncbi:MAG: PleD family two-component system response regulator [Caulobacterales bacterium]